MGLFQPFFSVFGLFCGISLSQYLLMDLPCFGPLVNPRMTRYCLRSSLFVDFPKVFFVLSAGFEDDSLSGMNSPFF